MSAQIKPTSTIDKDYFKNLIADVPMTSFQIFVVVMCFILNMNDGIDVLVVSYTGSEILSEWGLSKVEQGYIFSVGLAGMTLGCLLLAPLADWIGRRKLFILAIFIETIAMLLSSVVASYDQLLLMRFFAGLGIGGLLPTMAAVASEFSNNKRKDLSVGFVQAGYPVGAILMGFFAAQVVPEFGWRFAYLGAGIISSGMLVLVVLFMPESIEFLIRKQPRNALSKVNRVLKRMGQASIDQLPTIETIEKMNVKSLFSDKYRLSTIRLWIGVFFGFMTLYTLISWVPSIATDSGMPFEMATYVGVILNVGAFIGSIGIGWLAARYNLKNLIFTFFMIAFVIMVAYGNLTLNNVLIFVIIFLIGITVQGGFNGYWPTTARVYEPEVRATGIGWALGVGRLGAIAGPALFGVLADWNFSTQSLFIIFSVPLVVSGIAAYFIPSKNLS